MFTPRLVGFPLHSCICRSKSEPSYQKWLASVALPFSAQFGGPQLAMEQLLREFAEMEFPSPLTDLFAIKVSHFAPNEGPAIQQRSLRASGAFLHSLI